MFKTLALLAGLGVLLALYLNTVFSTNDLRRFFTLYESKNAELFTKEELSAFDGVQSPFLYLAILGNVFNVTKGSKHYGPGQQYNFFVGKDASRNFITGKFLKEFESDDVLGLTHKELLSLDNWLKLYTKDYPKIGKLIGRYYDEFGKLTPYARQIKKLLNKAHEKEHSLESEKRQFPPCNIEWDEDRGTRVWCTTLSGGIQRDWVGRPRQLYEIGSTKYRCACINFEDSVPANIKEYKDCDSDADSCFVK